MNVVARIVVLLVAAATPLVHVGRKEVRVFRDESGRTFQRCWDDHHDRVTCEALAPSGAVVQRWSTKDGALDGEWRSFCSDGTVRTDGRFEQGLRVGRWRTMHVGFPNADSGDVWTMTCLCPSSEGSYDRGRESGEWRRWGSGSCR